MRRLPMIKEASDEAELSDPDYDYRTQGIVKHLGRIEMSDDSSDELLESSKPKTQYSSPKWPSGKTLSEGRTLSPGSHGQGGASPVLRGGKDGPHKKKKAVISPHVQAATLQSPPVQASLRTPHVQSSTTQELPNSVLES
jgi:hypothetical protein